MAAQFHTAYHEKGANVPPDPNTTLDSAPDPSEDTQADESQDTGEDTQGNTVDWEQRYKELQRHTSQQLDQLRRQAEADSDEDEDEDEQESEDDDDGPAAPTQRYERDSWALAEQVYGQESIKAYDKAYVLLERAQTPADHIAAFEAYHQTRLDAEVRKSRKQQQAPGNEPAQPRVDPNRPDASPRNDFDRQAEEAFAKGDSLGFFQAAVRKVRGE